MAKDLNNPVNRLLRCLDEIGASFAEKLGVTSRKFEDLSQEKPPTELMGMINAKMGMNFVEEKPTAGFPELPKDEKAAFVEALLRKGRDRRDRYGELLLKSVGDTVVQMEPTSDGGTRYLVNDLRTGTPTTAQGNLLTREFRRLLRARYDWLKFLREITRHGSISFDEIWERFDKTHPTGDREAFFKTCAEEAERQGLEKWEEFRAAVDPLADFFLIESLFSKLRKLWRRKDVLNERDAKELDRYQDWFMDEFNLSPKIFEISLARGGICLRDRESTKKQKGVEGEISAAKNLEVALIFVDEAMTSLLRDAKKKTQGKK